MVGETSTVGTPTTTTTPNMAQTTIQSNSSTKKSVLSKRIEVENLAHDLQKKLGTNWDKYQGIISAFLVGRLSRKELTTVLNDLLTDSKMVRMHNQLLLANLANALRDGPNSASAKSGFGANNSNKKKKDSRVKVSSQYEKLKKDIMALPIRERHRIKTITRESGKQKMANSALTLTRQTLLPKIPYVSDKEKIVTGNTVEWTQDITHALQSLLSTETYSLPDNETLKTKMLGIVREHGLTGTIDKEALNVAYLGLEIYLRNIVESAIDTVRYRKMKYTDNDILNDGDDKINHKRQKKAILTNEDMVDTFNLFPFLVEPSGPLYRLHSVQLNDDTYVEPKTSIDEFLKPRAEVFNHITSGTSSSIIDKNPLSSTSNSSGLASSPLGKTNPSAQIAPQMVTPISIDGKENILSNNENTTVKDEQQTPSSSSTSGMDPKNEGINSGTSSLSSKSNVGTKDELLWLIHDIISAQ